jgi:hypothetical protein
MRMKKILVLSCSIFALQLVACINRKGIDVQVSNESGSIISAVCFTTSERVDSLQLGELKNRQSVTGWLSMQANKTDGSYVLRFKLNGKKRSLSGGYYTNGGPLHSSVNYVVKSDTILTQFR